MKYKYIVLFPVPVPYRRRIEELMNIAAVYTGIPPPSTKLRPHITFHRPIEGIDEEKLKHLVQSMVLQISKSRVTASGIYHFGKEYIVLPVHATIEVAYLWVGLMKLLSSLPEYRHGPFDYDNTLHVTIAEKTTAVFDTVYPRLHGAPFDAMTIPVTTLEIHRKVIGTEDAAYEKFMEYKIPKRRRRH